MKMKTNLAAKAVRAEIELARAGSPKEIQVKVRLPKTHQLHAVTVNGRAAQIGGPHGDTAIVSKANARSLEVVSEFSWVDLLGGTETTPKFTKRRIMGPPLSG